MNMKLNPAYHIWNSHTPSISCCVL